MAQTRSQLLDELESVVDRLTHLTASERSTSGTESAEHAQRLLRLTDRLHGVRLAELSVVDDSGVWVLDGSRSAKAWLARTSRCSQSRAGADLALARRLTRHLPGTRSALLAGGCSVEQARSMGDHTCDTELRRQALTEAERGEAWLLEHTHLGSERFATLTRHWAMGADPDAADAKHRADRGRHELFVSPTMGGGDSRGWLSPEVTEAFRTALRAEIGTPAADDHRTPGQRNHDALGSILSRVLGGGELGRSAQVRPTLVVHVPVETLLARSEGAGVRPELTPAVLQGSREPLPPSVLDKLACDGDVMRVVFGPRSQVLDLGRSQRLFTDGLRRALDARDGGCRRPGCEAPPYLCEGHHKVSWLDGGPTSLDNGVLLCWSCHDWVHRNGIQLCDGPEGELLFIDRQGQVFATSWPRGPTTLMA